jgi:hypothetical protein
MLPKSADGEVGGMVGGGMIEERPIPFADRMVGTLKRGAVAILIVILGACGASQMATPPGGNEYQDDFRQSMLDAARHVGDYMRQTADGKNLSELTLGWFVYDVLTEIASQDDDLNSYFNEDVQSYLKTKFHNDPAGEVARIDDLAKQGRHASRMAARYALEALRHIPNGGESTEVQARDRRDLLAALTMLREFLERSTTEITGSSSERARAGSISMPK